MTDDPKPVRDVAPVGGDRGRWVFRAAVAVGVSAGVVALLLTQIEVDVAEVLGAIEPVWLVYGFVLSTLSFLLRGVRFQILLPDAPKGVLTAALSVQLLMNRVLPMRLGELSLPYLLRRAMAYDVAKSLVALVLIRAVDSVLVLALLGVVALPRLPASAGLRVVLLFVGVGVLLVLLWNFVAVLRVMVATLTGVARALRLLRLAKVERLLRQLGAVAEQEGALSSRERFVLGAWSVLLLALQILLFDTILRAFDVSLDWTSLLLGSAVAFVGPAIPVPSVGSVGTLEAAWVMGFVWVGVPFDLAVVTGVATQVITLAFGLLQAGASWLYLEHWRSSRPPPVVSQDPEPEGALTPSAPRNG